MLRFAADLLCLCYQKKPSSDNHNYLKTELSKKQLIIIILIGLES